jgi:AcrR family transcriptional regulator
MPLRGPNDARIYGEAMGDAATARKRIRLTPQARRTQLMDAAGALAIELGYLPLPPERLSREAGVSKALIYAYFPTQRDLFNAVLARQFEALAAAGLGQASCNGDLLDAAQACSQIYFEQIARHGPLTHLILRDHLMVAHISADNRRFRDRIILRLARLARRELRLPAKETIAAINLVTTIPEQAGRLAWSGEMERDRARLLMSELVASSVAALRP